MNINEHSLSQLRERVSKMLSPSRFQHTLGVERAAAMLAEYLLPQDVTEIRVAALLHDVTKELDYDTELSLFREFGVVLTAEDAETRPAYHSFSAPLYIRKHLPEYATPNVLSAVKNHTLGATDMSTFDKIIHIADYVEEGRTYASSRIVRDFLYSKMDKDNLLASVRALDEAIVMSIDFTVSSLRARGYKVHSRTLETKKALQALI